MANNCCKNQNAIDITICREPDSPLIKDIRAEITRLSEVAESFSDLDSRLSEAIAHLDVISRATLLEILDDYAKKSDISGEVDLTEFRAEIHDWSDARFLRKEIISQNDYDALTPAQKNENILYVIQ